MGRGEACVCRGLPTSPRLGGTSWRGDGDGEAGVILVMVLFIGVKFDFF